MRYLKVIITGFILSSTAFATSVAGFEQSGQWLNTFISVLKGPILWGIAVISIILAALSFMSSHHDATEGFKRYGRIIGAVCLAIGAIAIITSITGVGSAACTF